MIKNTNILFCFLNINSGCQGLFLFSQIPTWIKQELAESKAVKGDEVDEVDLSGASDNEDTQPHQDTSMCSIKINKDLKQGQ